MKARLKKMQARLKKMKARLKKLKKKLKRKLRKKLKLNCLNRFQNGQLVLQVVQVELNV